MVPGREPPRRLRERWLPIRRWRARRGRVLAVKWGVNPNSSSLGADVTFLLFGAIAVALLTPLVALLLRTRGWLGAGLKEVGGAAPGVAGGSQAATGATAGTEPAPRADGEAGR